MANEQRLHLSVAEVIERHPLPWTHQVLMIKDANGRQVVHLGGLHDQFGQLYDGHYLAGLAAILAEAANATTIRRDDTAETEGEGR
jgi:hypothetical protein